MFAFLLAAAAMITPEAPFDASDASNPSFHARSNRYQDCIALIEEDVEIGRLAAQQWTDEGGAAPAVHCLAVADLAAGFPKLAALRLADAANRLDAGDILVRARLQEQAARAWLEAGEPAFAREAIDNAQKLAPNSGELSLTAGLVSAAQEQWQSTIDAITAAEEQGVSTIAGFIARARAYKALLQNKEAAEDVVAALKINPFDLDALVLRGELQQLGIAIDANYRRAPTQ
ncbi:MAG: hypothetical protein AAGJ87_07630 [Pseudomonadota bacterium]